MRPTVFLKPSISLSVLPDMYSISTEDVNSDTVLEVITKRPTRVDFTAQHAEDPQQTPYIVGSGNSSQSGFSQTSQGCSR
jgi:hypothetical protein